uniref:Triokinase/FMN cyclase n=1 Tax=Setaria digitata TaxID=48799 RepID=A0A915PZI7_9BILA
MAKKTNKFINDVSAVVDDSIRGLCCNRVVVRADIDKLKDGKQVALIAGGGSGHEPFAAGFVGKGLLSAAVCGNVFASPPTAHVTAGLDAICNKCGTGVFVINYTGDRLNFGLAVERFNTGREYENGKAEMVLISDDVALEGSNVGRAVGRRGLAGAVLLLKIAGAMAEEGKDLKAITAASRIVNDNMGTLGVSLSACSLPGKGPMFELAVDCMEIGLGIHGEPGFERSQYKTAKEVAKLLLEKLESSQKLNLKKGEKLVVLLNNLGGTSQIELNILSGEVCLWLSEGGYDIQRFYLGSVMTSLDGHGVSITILRLVSDDWLRYLDAATEAPAWKMTQLSPKFSSVVSEIKSMRSRYGISEHIGVTLSKEEVKYVETAIKKACIAVRQSVDLLNSLDGSAGDGDCGSTLKVGADKVLEYLVEGKFTCDKPQSLFNEISQIFEDDVGGTAGALYALMFSSAAQAFMNSATAKDWHVALKNGLYAIMKYGQAKPGSRSMVDPLHAAVMAITCDNPGKEEWENAVKNAEETAKATSGMVAQVGRASYTSAVVQKEPDAGAVAVSIWLRAVYEALYS